MQCAVSGYNGNPLASVENRCGLLKRLLAGRRRHPLIGCGRSAWPAIMAIKFRRERRYLAGSLRRTAGSGEERFLVLKYLNIDWEGQMGNRPLCERHATGGIDQIVYLSS